jgi:LacI family transcriptional regulator, galactose operon repressor
MSVTLVEIAKQAGVSRSTVSRVMTNHPSVDPETRSRVLAVAERLNYHPNLAARSLAAGKTRVLGLVIPMGVSTLFVDPYFPLLIQGISAACNANDYSVMLWLAEPEYERRTMGQILRGGMIDGVILASALLNDPVQETLLDNDIPFILVGRPGGDQPISYVDVDNVNSAREAVAYMFRLGYERVATITGPRNMIAGADRLEGYLLAVRDRGTRLDPDMVAESDFTEEGGYRAMQQLFAFQPDAIFAANDVMAVGALRALREAGKRVPDDVALMGFDDMPFSARSNPPISSVRQPIHRTGMLAAETLIDMVAHPGGPPRRIVLPTELMLRASCGLSRRRASVPERHLSQGDSTATP